MKKNRVIIALSILIILFVAMNPYFPVMNEKIGSNNQNNQSLPLNTSRQGLSIFYDALKKMDHDVRIGGHNFIERESGNIYIITEYRGSTAFNLKKAEDWIKNGGKLVYLTDDYHHYNYQDLIENYKDRAFLYDLGEGKLLIGDLHLIMNETLLEDKEGAIFILKSLEDLGGAIYFNEYYRMISGDMPSLYKQIPLYMKVILIQVLIFLACYIIYRGKRFGKAERIMEEIERDENEYLYAVANLYEKTESIDIIYDAYYKKLQNELKKTVRNTRSFTNWVDLWESQNLPLKEKADRVFYYAKENSKKRRRASLDSVKDMEELIDMLKKRREVFWEKLKQRN